MLGGSKDYTGAPFFASMSALRMGADLAYVLTAEEAAPALKAYSPELMVRPIARWLLVGCWLHLRAAWTRRRCCCIIFTSPMIGQRFVREPVSWRAQICCKFVLSVVPVPFENLLLSFYTLQTWRILPEVLKTFATTIISNVWALCTIAECSTGSRICAGLRNGRKRHEYVYRGARDEETATCARPTCSLCQILMLGTE